MALRALHPRVLPLERIRRPGVLETAGGLPRVLSVAALAVRPELAPVLVEVAGRAGGRRAEVADPVRLLREDLQHRRVADEAPVVAPRAVCAPVLAAELPPRAAVVELLPAALPPVHQREVAALVLVMAGLARGALRSGQRAVIAARTGHAVAQLPVALEAALARELLAGDVALRAVRDPLQRGVRLGEVPGRQQIRPGARSGEERQGGGERRGAGGARRWGHRRRSP